MADNLLSSFLPDDRASFGIFPQMKPKRRFQDPVGAANVPLDVTRGRVAGLAGLLPDVLNFMGRSPMPTEQFGETQYEPAQQLPYGSEYFLQNLPLKPTSRIGEVAGQAGAFVPLNPMPAARAVAAGVKALGPTAVRMGESYLQSKGLMPGVVPEAPVPPATSLASMMEKPQAPVSELGFYSATEQAALNLPRKSGTGESFLNDLMKGQDVKKDELSWMGLDDYLKGKPNVTRQEVQDFIANNRVDVQERQLGAAVAQDPVGIASRQAVFDKYEPQIQALYKEIDQYETNTINARNLASKNETEAIAALNREGNPQPIPTTDDWNRYYAAKAEMERVNKIPLDSREYVRKLDELVRARDAEANAAYVIPEPTPTRYQNYQLPGGENYREILLTLPQKKNQFPDFEQWLTNRYGGSEVPEGVRQAARKEYERQSSGLGISGGYQSGHFNEPNILAHMRVNDRVDADGKKMLLIEEIQSDWHQAGREKGYAGENQKALLKNQTRLGEIDKILATAKYTPEEGVKLFDEQRKLATEYGELEAKRARGGDVPDAPFKDTWHQLALKRALKYAADNGYDRVGLTTGRQQADRYQLSKQISEVHYSGTNFKAYDLDGNEAISRTGVKPEDLAGLIGKEPAKKLLEQPKQGTLQSLTGQNLDVGGEGMKKYYDEIYPAFLAKQGKKYNAKTGETRIKTGKNLQDEDFVNAQQRISEALGDYGERGYKTTDNRFFDTYADAVSHEKKISSKDPFDAPIRYIDISPKMRGGVKKGQPLFTAAPIGGIGLGAGTQDQQQNSINSFIQ